MRKYICPSTGKKVRQTLSQRKSKAIFPATQKTEVGESLSEAISGQKKNKLRQKGLKVWLKW
jgi:hypothetical protein